MTTEKPEFELGTKTDDELREFVNGVLSGEIFTSAQVSDQSLLPLVFMPLALGCYSDVPEEQLKEIGVLYAPMKAAAPRCINGLPMLFEVRAMSRSDWNRALAALRAEEKRRKGMPIPEVGEP